MVVTVNNDKTGFDGLEDELFRCIIARRKKEKNPKEQERSNVKNVHTYRSSSSFLPFTMVKKQGRNKCICGRGHSLLLLLLSSFSRPIIDQPSFVREHMH